MILNRYSVKTLSFNILFQRNDLEYLRPYSERQEKLHRIIEKLQEYRHMSLKSIADKLNALGIFKFSQIAKMTSEIEEEVNVAIEFFPGRVKRDEWVKQAAELAK